MPTATVSASHALGEGSRRGPGLRERPTLSCDSRRGSKLLRARRPGKRARSSQANNSGLPMRVSIVIPAQNASATIAETLRSVVEQVVSVFDQEYPRGAPWPAGPALVERLCRSLGPRGEPLLLGPFLDTRSHPLEIVVVDDGSTDDTAQLCSALGEALVPNVDLRVFSQPHGGPASACNLGIRKAVGDLVAFLDPGDLWLPSKLHKQVEALQAHPLSLLAYGDSLYFRHTGIYEPPGIRSETRRGGLIFENLLLEGNFIPRYTAVVRKSVLDTIQFDENPAVSSSEDYALWLAISVVGPVHYLAEPLGWYCVDRGSPSSSQIQASHRASRTALRGALALSAAKRTDPSLIRERFAHSWYEQGYEEEELGLRAAATRCFLRSVLTRPNLRAVKGLLRVAVHSIPGLAPSPRTFMERGEDSVSFI